ncbi:glutamate-1-semialdehyde 2,1-aminomutase protein (plasmid) [Rhizobium gallicum]|uniref:Glutamate-1-semialdehyde 2,1-aminomutase protein n=1 Tax=Rhizobium gallicum TaxID=56730 RepID=A0A1L5NV13_9HYPH|nr:MULTISPECIES: glutamate-1-semialdehyde 2,1-aminomutase [Rhizobium]APO71734.1 glutamate-1-semialdehyde 2,1-aminomutase protein [Rhizobium gallicum]QPB23067.1 glutamate-1-semialdehyde 2,1-aminomutase [Rhizobium sp. 007]
MTSLISNFENSKELRQRARRLIPGGAHTYAKGDDQYPVLSPGFIARGHGAYVFDVDGNKYIEFGMGNRAVSLGHAYPKVLRAVERELKNGANFTRPAVIELDCASIFLETIQGAEMVKFCKDGSHATSGAIRLARAVTGRDLVARCADHPFFSTDDWFIGTTPMNAGIPKAVRDMTLSFCYNEIDSAKALFEQHPGKIAAVILEPSKGEAPKDNFLHRLRDLCHANGALFILDEMITGFRWHLNGAQALYDIQPDLSCFGKAMGNGFAISALAGKRQFMELGGIDQREKPRVFLLSTTHGAETHAMAAAIATMKIYREEPVIQHLFEKGEALRKGISQIAASHGISNHFSVFGLASNLVYATIDEDGRPSQAFRTLFLQELIKRGVLAPSFVVSYTHGDPEIAKTLDAVDGALCVYRKALENGVSNYLVGRPSDVVFRATNRMTTQPDAVPALVPELNRRVKRRETSLATAGR